MLRTILTGGAVVVVALALFIATRPATFHIERSITMAAPPERAFAQVNDFHAWGAWSPWEKIDPEMQRTFSGPPSGPGAIYAWSGDRNIGKGRMTIVESDAPSHIGIKLEFFEPMAATSTAKFTFAPVADGTKVTWAMDGENNFVGKAVSLFMNMDTMIGGNFESGLAALKTLSESPPTPSAAARTGS